MTSVPISIPQEFTLAVALGDTVSVGDVLAQKKNNVQIVHLAEVLDCPPGKVRATLRKNPGDRVKPGDILAIKQSLLGPSVKKAQSNVSGTILRFERISGDIVIELDEANGVVADMPPDETISSPVKGVVKTIDGGDIVLDTDAFVITGNKGFGGGAEGELFFFDKSGTIAFSDLTPSVSGKIVAGQSFEKSTIIKAVGMDVAGCIAVEADEETISYIAERSVSMPFIVISADDFKKLSRTLPRRCVLDGKMRIIIGQ